MQAIIDNIIWVVLIIIAAAGVAFIIYLPFKVVNEIKLRQQYKVKKGDTWWKIWQKYEREMFIKRPKNTNFTYPFTKEKRGNTVYTKRFIKNLGHMPTDDEYNEIKTLYNRYVLANKNLLKEMSQEVYRLGKAGASKDAVYNSLSSLYKKYIKTLLESDNYRTCDTIKQAEEKNARTDAIFSSIDRDIFDSFFNR